MNKGLLFGLIFLLSVGFVNATTQSLAYYKYYTEAGLGYTNFELSNDGDWDTYSYLNDRMSPNDVLAYYYFNTSAGVTSANLSISFVLDSALEYIDYPDCVEGYPAYANLNVQFYNFNTSEYDELSVNYFDGIYNRTIVLDSRYINVSGDIIVKLWLSYMGAPSQCENSYGGHIYLYDLQIDYVAPVPEEPVPVVVSGRGSSVSGGSVDLSVVEQSVLPSVSGDVVVPVESSVLERFFDWIRGLFK